MVAVADDTTTRSFSRRAEAPGLARSFVAGAIAEAGGADRYPDAMLLVSELVSNSVLHTTSGTVTVGVDLSADRLRCAVTDGDPSRLPEPQIPDRRRIGGRGLRIVDAAAHRWGCDADDSSKTVWFELDPAGAGRGTPRGAA